MIDSGMWLVSINSGKQLHHRWINVVTSMTPDDFDAILSDAIPWRSYVITNMVRVGDADV